MIALVFRYEVRDSEEFERVYGPEGEWAQFFRAGRGYIGIIPSAAASRRTAGSLRGLARHHRLSAQDAVLIGKRQAHDLEPVFLDPLVGLDGGFELLVVPQSVALDEAVRGSLLR